VKLLGKDADGGITRAPFALDLAKAKPLVTPVNELFKKHSGGRDMSDVPARAFTGFMVLADAINRAGSTKPEAIQKALRETNIPPDQLIMPWTSVRFDESGQNTGVKAILQQIQGGAYQGLGYALGEEVVVQDGQTASTLLASYLVPNSADLPDVRAIIVESGEGKGPFGARGIGEPTIGNPAATIANAVAAATGVRVTQLPITPERLLAAIDAEGEDAR